MKVIKITECFAGIEAGKVLKMENQVAASLVRRGVAIFEATDEQPATDEQAEPEVKKETIKSKKTIKK